MIPPGEGGNVTLTQLWDITGVGVVKEKGVLKLLAGRTYHLPPFGWTKLYVPFKLESINGGVTVVASLSRVGLVSGSVVTSGGMLYLSVYNSTGNVVRLTPKTHLLTVRGFREARIDRFVELSAVELLGEIQEEEITSQKLSTELEEKYPEVCDITRHPVTPAMKELEVKAYEVQWTPPKAIGQRTPFKTEEVADRTKVEAQLEDYVRKGYLRSVSTGEHVFLSPLLPLKKPNGDYRFTTDFRSLNAYFTRSGQVQVDVWRKLWQVRASWRWYAKIDLKDGFFGVPVDAELQRLFAFSWGGRRFCWCRLPQGWTWSSVLFAERVAEIVCGVTGVVQFADDLLVGAETRQELRRRTHEVFVRLQRFGLKVNVNKAEFVTTSVKFLGLEIEDGRWSLARYLRKKADTFGELKCWKDLERMIGVLSYARRTIPHIERLLSPLRGAMRDSRSKRRERAWWKTTDEFCKRTFKEIMERQVFLHLPAMEVSAYVLETDWADGYAGYLLFAQTKGERLLCDLGSKKMAEHTSSFLGELRAVVWGCQSTKALRGDLPLFLRVDNQSVADVLAKKEAPTSDLRAYRLWTWLVANESYEVEFLPGDENRGADLLSRPGRRKRQENAEEYEVSALTGEQLGRLEEAHRGHFGWRRTLDNLRRQGLLLWPGVVEDVKTYVRNCPNCARFGELRKRPVYAPLRFERPNQVILADFAGPWSWPSSEERIWVLVLLDGYSRYLRLHVCNQPDGGAVVRALRQWCEAFGPPSRLMMDRATAFLGVDVEAECSVAGIERVFIAARAHWSAGLVERAIRTLLGRVRRLGNIGPWSVAISRVEEAYNSSYHSGVDASPREVFLGTRENGSELTNQEWSEVLAKAQWTTEEARRKRALQFQKAKRPTDVPEVGDLVHYAVQTRSKLDDQWSGPAAVVERLGSRLYYLRDPQGRFGPFHAWQLKRA